MKTVVDYLKAMRDLRKHQFRNVPAPYLGVEDFLLQHGRTWTRPKTPPLQVVRGLPKNCYNNAMLLALSHRTLTYVEGYARSGVLPVHHAWCVTPEGLVVDNTWNFDRDEEEYFGVAFTTEALKAIVDTRLYNPTFLDNYDDGHPLLCGVIRFEDVVDLNWHKAPTPESAT